MDSSVTFLIFIIVLCIMLSAFFSSSETALISLNKYKLRTAVLQKRYGAVSADKLLSNPEKLISMILICNNVVNIVASSLATLVGQTISGDMGIAVATGILTFVLLMFAEIIPKTIASKYPDKVAFSLSPILVIINQLATPIVFIFNIFTKLFFKILRINQESTNSSLSNDELRVIVKESQKLVGKDHSDMLNSILDLEQVVVEDIMVPRHEINAIDIEDDMKSIMRQLSHASNSRIIVYKESLENRILGILRIREAYRLMLETNEYTKETLVRSIDEPVFIQEGTTLTRQLLNFKRAKRKIGLVVDEYGFCIGLISIEDILEEIVGNFTINSVVDEEEDISQISQGLYEIDGQANLRDLNKKFGWDLHADEARTLNGYLLEHFQEIPQVGEVYKTTQFVFTIKETDRKRICTVEIKDLHRYNANSTHKDELLEAKKTPNPIKPQHTSLQ